MNSIYIAFGLFGAFCTLAGMSIGFMISAADARKDDSVDKAIADSDSTALDSLPD